MKATKAMELMKKYVTCPECGNSFIGNGQGECVVDQHSFMRSCKCGWKVIIKEREEDEKAKNKDTF